MLLHILMNNKVVVILKSTWRLYLKSFWLLKGQDNTLLYNWVLFGVVHGGINNHTLAHLVVATRPCVLDWNIRWFLGKVGIHLLYSANGLWIDLMHISLVDSKFVILFHRWRCLWRLLLDLRQALIEIATVLNPALMDIKGSSMTSVIRTHHQILLFLHPASGTGS